MAHLRLRLFLTAMLIVSIATCAWACPPNAANSTAPSRVRLVNARAGVPDRSDGQFTVVIRDNANNPMPGASVTLDFSGVPDVVLCSDQLDPDMLMSCAAHTVRKFTNAQGQVTFTVLGSSTGVNDVPSLGQPAMIFADGVLLGNIAVSTFDLDGMGGVGANDLSILMADFGSGQPHDRSDFDGSGTVGANDLSQWLGVFASGASSESCRSACP
jgi:hypothetical protein